MEQSAFIKHNSKLQQDQDSSQSPLFAQLSKLYQTDLVNGLTTIQSSRRMKNNGPNCIDNTSLPLNAKLWKKITSKVYFLHVLSSVVFFMLYFFVEETSNMFGNLSLGVISLLYMFLIIFGELLLESHHNKLLNTGNNLIKYGVIIWRDGRRIEITKQNLVVGDIIQISNGQQIPADIHLIDCRSLVTDQYPITGDHKPVSKQTQQQMNADMFNVKNMLFSETYCIEGWGKGIVIRTGKNTLFGQIRAITNKRGKKFGVSLLEEQKIWVDEFKIRIGIFLASVIIFGALIMERDFWQGVQIGIFVFVLCLNTTMKLALNFLFIGSLQKLKGRKVLVENKNSLFSVSKSEYICSDRTAVITQNNLDLVFLWYDKIFRKADSLERVPKNYQFEYNQNDSTFKVLQEAIISITEATFNKDYKERHRITHYYECQLIGDNFDGALIKFIQPIVDVQQTRATIKYGKKKEGTSARLPYNNSRKYELCIIKKKNDNSDYTVYVMGVAENVWSMCSYLLVSNKSQQITKQDTQNFQKMCLERATNGEKPIGVAMLQLDSKKFPKGHRFNLKTFEFSLSNLTFIGGLFLHDPLNIKSMQTLIKLQNRGIKYIILSSQPLQYTEHMSKQLKISNIKTNLDLQKQGMPQFEAINNSSHIIFNSQLLNSKPELLRLLTSKSLLFFSQVTTSLKQQILKFYQTQGLLTYVAGRNTSQILQADILIANGIQVRKGLMNKADIVLADDRFENIEGIVKQSLRIGSNLSCVVTYSFWRGFVGGILGIIWLFYGVCVGDLVSLLLILTFGEIYPTISLCFESYGNTNQKIANKNANKSLISYLQIALQLIFSCFVVFSSFMRYSRFQSFYLTHELYLLGEIRQETLLALQQSYTISIYILSVPILFYCKNYKSVYSLEDYNMHIFISLITKILFVFVFMDGFGVLQLHLWYLIIFICLFVVADGVVRVIKWFMHNLGVF